MSRMIRLFSLMLAVIVMFTCVYACAEDTVLAEVNGIQITRSEVEEYLLYYYSYGYIDDYADYSGMVDMLIDYYLELQMLTDLGFFNFTEEEEDALRAEALNEKEAFVEEYIAYFLSEDSEEAREELRKQAMEYYEGYEENIYSGLLNQAAYDDWYASVAGNAVTDEDVLAAFNSYVEEDKAAYAEDIAAYEIDYYYGYRQFYMPEGYRRILRVLIEADDTLTEAFLQAQAAWEETLDDNNDPTEGTAEAASNLERARQDLLGSVKEKTDAVYAALEGGASFPEVIALYGEDAFMTVEYGGLEEGYPVHRESIMYDSSFVSAAFGDDMVKPGDYSAPAAGSDGVSILYYMSDIPSGAVELTDELFTDIREYLESMAAEDVLAQQLEEYRNNSSIVINTKAIEEAAEAAD